MAHGTSGIIGAVSLRTLDPGTPVGARRGQVVICIPVYGGHEHFAACLDSVLDHTPADVVILVCDDASPDRRSGELVAGVAERSEHELVYMRQARNVGFPVNVNAAFAAAAPADVLVLNSDCLVAAGWLEGLRAAAYDDSRVATATSLTNHGTLVSVPDRRPQSGLPHGWTFSDAAAAVRERSLRLRPRLPTAIGHCVYFRRSALELVGAFDPAFTPGYGEEVDFSQRCLHRGLCHVLADDVLVLHHGGGSFSSNGARSPAQDEHERILKARYPYYHHAVRALEEDATGPLPRALGCARRALLGLDVVMDGRVLAGPTTGTQLHVLELIAALARTGEARLSVIVSHLLPPYARGVLESLADVRLLTRGQAETVLERNRADVVHRPFQVHTEEDLVFLGQLADRLVVTNQDLIGYQNPSYFRDADAWAGYRRTTRAALSVADHVFFFSEHARDDALAEDLVDPARASVVRIGVDHRFDGLAETPVAPAGVAGLSPEAEAILCIGTDFRHKNRLFALRLLEQLQLRHGWSGVLVLAGPQVVQGSSGEDERRLLAERPAVAKAVLDVGAVTEGEKEWLYRRCRLVVYPTVFEGFGLVPFEAAERGVPCMWAPGTALSEVLPDGAATITPWQDEQSADRALELLREEDLRARNVAAVREAARSLTWDATAARLIELYGHVCAAPTAPATAVERRYGLLATPLSEDAMRLLGPGGALPPDVERPLLALATHPQIGAPMFRAMKLGYRASYLLRRRGRGRRRP